MGCNQVYENPLPDKSKKKDNFQNIMKIIVNQKSKHI